MRSRPVRRCRNLFRRPWRFWGGSDDLLRAAFVFRAGMVADAVGAEGDVFGGSQGEHGASGLIAPFAGQHIGLGRMAGVRGEVRYDANKRIRGSKTTVCRVSIEVEEAENGFDV